jgi:hypothetical protein
VYGEEGRRGPSRLSTESGQGGEQQSRQVLTHPFNYPGASARLYGAGGLTYSGVVDRIISRGGGVGLETICGLEDHLSLPPFSALGAYTSRIWAIFYGHWPAHPSPDRQDTRLSNA